LRVFAGDPHNTFLPENRPVLYSESAACRIPRRRGVSSFEDPPLILGARLGAPEPAKLARLLPARAASENVVARNVTVKGFGAGSQNFFSRASIAMEVISPTVITYVRTRTLMPKCGAGEEDRRASRVRRRVAREIRDTHATGGDALDARLVG
jgi:hypothetical protein